MFWHQKNWDQLVSRIKNNSMPHALLLTGARGLGKLQFAKQLSGLLLCEKNADKMCGECRSCQLFNAGNHPDFELLQPEEVGKAIKIDQIRYAIMSSQHTSQQGGFRIIVIEPADQMNISAANALLKTLEEPPGDCIIILVSSKAHNLPATILSRCQKIVFNLPKFDEAKVWLENKLQLKSQEVSKSNMTDLLLAHADGAPLKALELFESESYRNIDKLINDFMDVYWKKLDAIKFAADYLKVELPFILLHLMNSIADILKIKFQVNDKIINHSKLQLFRDIAENISVTKLFAFYDEILDINRLLESNININKNLALEKLLLLWVA